MRKNNKDLVPIMASSGEQIASNPALELMGRDVIPYFNNLALKAKEQDMKPHNYANGTTKRGGVQMPELAMRKTGLGAYADGTVTASGLQLPRLGSALDSGNSINTPPGQIPGVVRNGNSYSQAPGFVPTQTLTAPPPTGIRSGHNRPFQGYVDGTQDEYGVKPLQQPSLLDVARGLFSSNDRPQAQVSAPQPLAPTVEQSRLNYELQPRQEGQGYAVGTRNQDGILPEDIDKLGTYGNMLSAQMIRAPYNGTPSLIAQNNQAQAEPVSQPVNSTMTDRGGLSTLAGDGYSVSSGAKGMGAFSTPESLAALDSTMAYNKTQGAKDQFAANAALSQGRYDAARQPQVIQQPQQSFEYPQQADYQDQIQSQIDRLGRSSSSIGGFDRMIAQKRDMKNAQAGLAALLDLQKGAQDTGVDYAKMNQQANQFGQELGFKQQQQSFANKLGLGELAAKNSLAQIEQQDKERRFNLDQSKADSEKARLEQTKYGIVKDPITNEQSIAPLSGKDADRAYKVQVRFAERELNPEYKAVVEKFGQQKADQMYIDKLRQAVVREDEKKQGMAK